VRKHQQRLIAFGLVFAHLNCFRFACETTGNEVGGFLLPLLFFLKRDSLTDIGSVIIACLAPTTLWSAGSVIIACLAPNHSVVCGQCHYCLSRRQPTREAQPHSRMEKHSQSPIGFR